MLKATGRRHACRKTLHIKCVRLQELSSHLSKIPLLVLYLRSNKIYKIKIKKIKKTISFIMSVRMELGYHWTDFHET